LPGIDQGRDPTIGGVLVEQLRHIMKAPRIQIGIFVGVLLVVGFQCGLNALCIDDVI
jgi:hypothetical protein